MDSDAPVVDIWTIRLDTDVQEQRRLARTLSQVEIDTASAFRFEHLRRRFVVRRGAYREILAEYVRVDPRRLEFTMGEFGKPRLADVKIEHNASHSGELALIAVTTSGPVGIDVEAVRDLDSADEWLSPAERTAVRQLPAAERAAASLRLWTRKEAHVKALGVGLSLLGPDMSMPSTSHDCFVNAPMRKNWQILDVDLPSPHVASLAFPGSTPTIVVRAWPGCP